MRRLHYSIRTERTFCARVEQFVRFCRIQSLEALPAAGSDLGVLDLVGSGEKGCGLDAESGAQRAGVFV